MCGWEGWSCSRWWRLPPVGCRSPSLSASPSRPLRTGSPAHSRKSMSHCKRSSQVQPENYNLPCTPSLYSWKFLTFLYCNKKSSFAVYKPLSKNSAYDPEQSLTKLSFDSALSGNMTFSIILLLVFLLGTCSDSRGLVGDFYFYFINL